MMWIFKNVIQRTTFSSIHNFSTDRETKLLGRMINQKMKKMNLPESKNSKPTTFNPVLLTKKNLWSAYDNENSSKRTANLNKLYMEQITAIINGGQFMSQLEDVGVEITKVKIAKGLNFLNIYWRGTKLDVDENVLNETLTKALAELQREIGGVRYTSSVPYLRFVRDVRLENEIRLNQVFDSADFGKDFEPVYGKKVLSQSFVHERGGFPKMRQDVLGLNHEEIKGTIEDKLFKFKAIKIDHTPTGDTQTVHEFPEKLITFSKREYYIFYNRRRILELKHRKKFGKNFTNEMADNEDEEVLENETDDDDYYDDESYNEKI